MLNDRSGMQKQTSDALMALTELYEAWQKPDKAAEFHARLNSLQASIEAHEG